MRSPHFVLAIYPLPFLPGFNLLSIVQQDTIASLGKSAHLRMRAKKKHPANKAPVVVNGPIQLFFIKLRSPGILH